MDDDFVNHRYENYHVLISPDPEKMNELAPDRQTESFDPIDVDLSLHFYSKSERSAPVHVEFEGKIKQAEVLCLISGKVKTASAWAFLPFGIEKSEICTEITTDEWRQYGEKWLEKAKQEIRHTVIAAPSDVSQESDENQ